MSPWLDYIRLHTDEVIGRRYLADVNRFGPVEERVILLVELIFQNLFCQCCDFGRVVVNRFGQKRDGAGDITDAGTDPWTALVALSSASSAFFV